MKHFYSDQKKYAFSFQAYMLKMRLFQMMEASRMATEEEVLVLMDRGALGDTCFAKYNYLQGKMEDDEFDLYSQLCNAQDFVDTASSSVDTIVYLDVDPQDCLFRVRNMRKTAAEQEIPLEYFQGIDDMYFDLMLGILEKGSPRVLVMTWGGFGDTDTLLTHMNATLQGRRIPPRVVFEFKAGSAAVAEAGAGYPCACYDTEEDIDAMFAVMRAPGGEGEDVGEGHPPMVRVRWDMCIEKKDHLNATATEKFTFHNNPYKRVVMHHLSLGHHMHFY